MKLTLRSGTDDNLTHVKIGGAQSRTRWRKRWRITQVRASLAEIPHGVDARRRRTIEAFNLGKYVPDPVVAFAASPNFRAVS
jgi:hypothetical protein